MTKPEIYQALADGVAASVQRYSNCYEGDGEWLTAGSEYRLIGWLASDAANFDPERYRIKPTPVPPGDLTWEEAEAAHKRGEKVERWNQTFREWNAYNGVFVDYDAYRLAPAPKMRTIRAEELPAFFWVSFGENDVPDMCTKVSAEDNEIKIGDGWHVIANLRKIGVTYSEHHSKGPWHKFEVEEQQ